MKLTALLLAALGFVPAATPRKPLPADAAQRVLAVAAAQVGVRERTGNNDGPRVEAYLASTGLGKGNPYCAAFVHWCGKQALGSLNPYPRSAWSPDMVQGGSRDVKGHAAPAAAFGIWSTSRGRVAHTGFVVSRSGSYLNTIEGNTSAQPGSPEADREGGGVYRRIRPVSTIYSVKRWIP